MNPLQGAALCGFSATTDAVRCLVGLRIAPCRTRGPQA
jgi:hypothetical protein